MCGIIGYSGTRDMGKFLLDSLKNLEYRGYDSVGMAVLKDSEIIVRKDIGEVSEVNKKLSFEELDGSLGIAHTRWATTGEVNQVNAHPQLSNDKSIAVVHNGIVENFQELKEFLISRNYFLKSDTDTEVIPVLIQFFMDEGFNFRQSVRNALKKVEGSFAVLVFHKDENILIGAKRESPLVLGVGRSEFFLASDTIAFLKYTKKIVYLNDDEYVVINNDYSVRDLKTDEIINKNVEELNWIFDQADKGDYSYFMMKEIMEQAETVNKALNQPKLLIKKASELINESRSVFFVGCGTSYHACVSASYLFSKIAKKHINIVLASEFRNYEHFLNKNTLVVAVSQSGETADLLDAVKFAKKHNCRTLSIVNVMGSTLTRLCSINIMMNAGPEICVLSTKSYTSQLAILTLLAYSSAGMMEKGRRLVEKVSENIPRVIDENKILLESLAEKFKNCRDFFLIGRGLAYPSALEGALKIKEVSYIHAEGFAGAELKHGSIALIEKDVPLIVFSTKNTEKLILSNASEVKSRGGCIIGIGSRNHEVYDYFIKVPEMGSTNPLLMIIPIQILAYYLAVFKGLNPDKPRNLAKSVTVK